MRQDDFKPGQRWMVEATGCRLRGWKPIHGGQEGWGRELERGEVIECSGVRNGWGSDPAPEVHFSHVNGERLPHGDCTFWPCDGPNIFMHAPANGTLRLMDEDE